MKEFQTMANDLCQRALVGSPIKASLIKEFFANADIVVASANAVRSVFQSFTPNIENDLDMSKDVVCESQTNSESEV